MTPFEKGYMKEALTISEIYSDRGNLKILIWIPKPWAQHTRWIGETQRPRQRREERKKERRWKKERRKEVADRDMIPLEMYQLGRYPIQRERELLRSFKSSILAKERSRARARASPSWRPHVLYTLLLTSRSVCIIGFTITVNSLPN